MDTSEITPLTSVCHENVTRFSVRCSDDKVSWMDVNAVSDQPAYSRTVKCINLHKRSLKSTKGFTLVELLCVIAIIVTLSVTMLPMIGSVLLLSARKSAVDEMMGAFENARIAALSSGAYSYVGFAANTDANIPVQDQYREYVIFRERTEDDPASNASYIQLTKWKQLPQGVSFRSTEGILTENTLKSYVGLSLPGGGKAPGAGVTIPVLCFTPTGSVTSTGTNLAMYIYEGSYILGTDHFTSKNKTFLERLSFSHYTGRVQADVVADGL